MNRLTMPIAGFIAGLAISSAFAQAPLIDANNFGKLVFRVQELERKIAGVQKQITVLHAIAESLDKKIDMVSGQTNSEIDANKGAAWRKSH